MKRTFSLHILFLILSLSVGISGCKSMIYDDLQPCPVWIGFNYNYNMPAVNLFHRQAHDVQILAFDSNDCLIGYWSEQQQNYPENYLKELPLTRSCHRLVAVSGMDKNYLKPQLHIGKTHYQDIKITLSKYEEGQMKDELIPLLVGEINPLQLRGEEGETHIVPMKKWTNKVKLLFQDMDNQLLPIKLEDYIIEIRTKDGIYSLNGNKEGNKELIYTPYIALLNGKENGGAIEFSIMRLMENEPVYFHIIRKKDNYEMINANLIPMLEETRFYQHREMSNQEYLDREDKYTIVFIAKSKDFVSFDIMINDWVLHSQNEVVE